MKTQKRWISLLLALVLLLACLPAAQAATAAAPAVKTETENKAPEKIGDFEVSDDHKAALKYVGTDPDPTIPSPIITIGSGCFKDNMDITSVNLNKVVYIQAEAFSGCEYLEKVTGLKNVLEIGQYAFFNCRSLEKATLNNKLAAIETGTFQNCISLTDVHIPTRAAYIGVDAFSTCTNLDNVKVPSTVKSIADRAFYHCTNLRNITISGSITTMGTDTFANCPNILIRCYRGSAAEKYAQDHALQYTSLDPVVDTIDIAPKDPQVLIYNSNTQYAQVMQFTATITPAVAAGTQLQWTTSNPAAVTVSQTGVVTVRKAGQVAEIWASWTSPTGFKVSSNHVIIHTVDSNNSSGWYTINKCYDGKKHVFMVRSDTDTPQTRVWKWLNGRKYYFDKYGFRVEGSWQKDAAVGGWHYLWQKLPDPAKTGSAAMGFFGVGSYRYYGDPKTAIVQQGWVKYKKYWYFFGPDEQYLKKTVKTGADLYMRSSTWLKVKGKYYYVNDKGHMAVGWKNIGAYRYYFDKNGARQTGWLKLKKGGPTYYLDANGRMYKGFHNIGGKYYFFNSSGVMKTGSMKLWGKTYIFDSKGVLKTKGNPPVDPKKINTNVKKTFTMKKGKTLTITAKLVPSYARKDIEFFSSNKSVLVVNKTTGKVTAKKAGTAVIEIRAYGYDGVYVSKKITVTVTN